MTPAITHKRGRLLTSMAATLAAIAIAGVLTPIAAVAAPQQRREEQGRNDRRRDDRRREESDNRQKTKNEWRNLAIAAGGVAAFGLIKKDPTIGFLGAAGSLYSLNRYEQDRKSQDRTSRARANIFSQNHFYRDGQRYERRSVQRNGQRYYQFVRSNDSDQRDRRDRRSERDQRDQREQWRPRG